MPFITTVPSIVWKEDLDNMERVQSRKSGILFCLTSGRTINLSEKKTQNTAVTNFMTFNEKELFPLSKLVAVPKNNSMTGIFLNS